MEFRQFARLFLKWWWLLLLGVAVAGAAGYYSSLAQVPIYRASVTLLVNQAQGNAAISYNDILSSQQLVKTYAQLVRKTPTLDRVIQKLGLPGNANALGTRIQVDAIRDTMLFQVSVDDPNPVAARDIANAVAEVFIIQRRDEQLGKSSASRAALEQQIDALERQTNSLSQSLSAARATRNPDAAEIARLQTDLSQSQLIYSQLVKNDQDMQLAEARAFDSIKVAEPASVPASPISPMVPQNTLLAVLVGLLLAGGAAFLIEYLDDTVKRAEDVQRLVAMAVLGVVSRIPVSRGAEKAPRLISRLGVRSSLGEAFRILRVNVDFAWAGQPGRTIVVTSGSPAEGKSTVLANLAEVFANDNRRVIMVDGDLRRPSLHRTFEMEATPGLTNLLADPAASASQYVRPTKTQNLMLLTSGPIPPNPSELLGSPRFQQVLEELTQLADFVLVDSPPILAVADTQLMCAKVDGVVVVVDAGSSRSQALIRTNEVLARGSARVLGVVLNKLSRRSADYYYHYYYKRYCGKAPEPSNGIEKQPQEVRS